MLAFEITSRFIVKQYIILEAYSASADYVSHIVHHQCY